MNLVVVSRWNHLISCTLQHSIKRFENSYSSIGFQIALRIRNISVMGAAQGLWLNQLKAATHYNQWIFSQIQPYIKGHTLEVGCGIGTFTEPMAHVCSQVLAVDLNETYVQQARDRLSHCSNLQIRTADATQLQGNQTFDTIVMLDVLEHIEDDVGVLWQLGQCLAPNGTLILKVPAFNALYNSMDEAVDHYRRYTQASLQEVLKMASFMPVEMWYFNMAGIPGWWLNGTVLRQRTPVGQQVGWFDRCVPLFQSIESYIRCPVGLSLVAIASFNNNGH